MYEEYSGFSVGRCRALASKPVRWSRTLLRRQPE
nr:MAG TPA: hypothetical protein [Caudoviricetes sp.]